MRAFGDESGHLRGVFNGSEECFSLGLVYGSNLDCQRCPQRALRRLEDVPEIKWADLRDFQKRRIMECISEEVKRVYWISIDQEMLNGLSHSYALYNHDVFDIGRDLAIMAIGYLEMLFPIDTTPNNHYEFTFDQLFDSNTSESLSTYINDYLSCWEVQFGNSRRFAGIQTADCIAGAASEDYSSNSNWLNILSDEMCRSVTNELLIQIEYRLSEARTDP